MIGAALPHASCILIYTAASYKPSPGMGGYSAILHRYTAGKRTGECELTGGDTHTDNVRLEMSALVAALRMISRDQALPIIIRVNNEMISRAMTEWLPGWIVKGWRKGDGKPVENPELWKEIISLREGLNVTFEPAKAHAGDVILQKAKRLATKAREEQRPKTIADLFGSAA